MAPRTRKAIGKRRSNHGLQDGDEMEEHGQQQNEQQPDMEISRQPIQKQVMGLMAPRTRRATANRNAHCGFQDKQQMMERQQQSRQQLQPQIFPQASGEQVMGPRTRKATGNLSGCRRLLDKNQMEGVGQHQNEEEVEFQTTQQTNGQQVTAPRTQRSTVKRKLNHGLLDEDEVEENGQQENEQHSNLEVTEALQNALKILMTSSTRRATTNQNSHCGFQDKHQRKENGHQQNRRWLQPPISQQVSMMAPTTRKATGNHRLRDESQMEGYGQHQNEEPPDFRMTQQVMAPSTRRSTAKRKLNHVLLDEDEIEEHGQQENDQQPDLKFAQEIENASKILMAPSTRRATTNLKSHYGFRDKYQMKENGQLQNRQQLQPQISHQASMMAPRTRKTMTNQSRYHGLRYEDQMERHRQHQNEEQPEFQSTQQTKGQQVMTPSTRRSTAGRKVNHGLLDEGEIEEHVQQENEQESNLEVSQAIENALKILMAPITRRTITNGNSRFGFQNKHQMKDNMQQQSRQQQQPQFSQQASTMPSRTQNATTNQRGYHSLQDEDPMEGDEQHQNEEPQEIQMTQQTNDKKGTIKRTRRPTFLCEVWGNNPNEERIIVNFNKRGQPVGPNKKIFVGFLVTLARNSKYAKHDIEDWRKVPKENKDEMIKMVKERFEVPEGAEHWILLSIGKKRNSWKSRDKNQCFVPTLAIEDQAHKTPASGSHSISGELGSHSIADDINEDSFAALTQKRLKETRTRHNEKLWRLVEEIGKIPVTFHKYDGRPSGRYAAMFMTELGVVVRAFAPIKVKGWKHITTTQKQSMFDQLQSAFVVDLDDGPESVKKETEQLMKEIYRNNRARMHEYYKKYCINKPWEERLIILPKAYCDDESDWEFMCKLFESEKFKARSKTNVENRSKQKYNHRGGSKSFVQHSYECGNGPAKVDRIVLFKRTRYNEAKGWIEGAEFVYNELVERRDEYRREQEDLNSYGRDIQPMDELVMTSQACDNVFKLRSGYICGLGKGPKPSKSIASNGSSRRSANVELRQELDSTKDELETTRASLQSAEEKIHKLEETMEANQMMVMQVFQRIAPDVLQSFMDKPSSSSAPPRPPF